MTEHLTDVDKLPAKDQVRAFRDAVARFLTSASNPGRAAVVVQDNALGSPYHDLVMAMMDIDAMLVGSAQLEGVTCVHCNGSGDETQHYDGETGWSEARPCDTCNGSGRITTVEQYLKTVPANWHENSSLETWFPCTAKELKTLERKLDTCGLQCSATMKSLMAENEQLRTALTGISTCSTCEACRGAALRTLGSAVDERLDRVERELVATPGQCQPIFDRAGRCGTCTACGKNFTCGAKLGSAQPPGAGQ